MYPSHQQQNHQSGYRQQGGHHPPDVNAYQGGHPMQYVRSSSVSEQSGYQQAPSPQYDNMNMNSQQHYYHMPDQPQQSYPASSQDQSFQAPVRRGSIDPTTYNYGHSSVSSPSALRGRTLSLQQAPTRVRALSYSYNQERNNHNLPMGSYNQPPYTQDPRYAATTSAEYPPMPYHGAEGGASSHHPRPIPTRVDTSPSVLYRPEPRMVADSSPSPLSGQSPVHLRREMPVSSTPQPYAQTGVSVSGSGASTAGFETNSMMNPGTVAAGGVASSQPRPHVCDSCGLAFVRGHDLKRHKDTHLNSKPHICECGKSFSRKDALKRHIFLKSCRGATAGNEIVPDD
ncbi:hypothetical protein CPB86DRAFT_732765 [Serendipita vermifera]|nr:hypothetical protein CPB86DRAFT_732765 [Serendipita vermifera]